MMQASSPSARNWRSGWLARFGTALVWTLLVRLASMPMRRSRKIAITAGSSQAGAFTLSAGDSALIATLAPGAYTVLVTGTGGASGIALVEVYELP